jgi:CHAP domain
MSRLPAAGCGCLAVAVAFVLCAPLLLFSGGGSATAAGSDRVVPSGGTSCAAAVGCQALPAELIGVPHGFFPDRFADPPGECTSWAAALWPGHHGRGVSWSRDAWAWYSNAAAAGYAVSAAPSVGAIAVFARTASGNGQWGHVGVVLTVASTSFVITEMNWAGRFVVDQRSVPLDADGITGFIPVPADAWS